MGSGLFLKMLSKTDHYAVIPASDHKIRGQAQTEFQASSQPRIEYGINSGGEPENLFTYWIPASANSSCLKHGNDDSSAYQQLFWR